ncbi:hypothetical protein ACP4OV_014838 [Aristida adscensionis]
MDALNTLPVRFHFMGLFVNEGNKVEYVGGREAISYIDRDKVSLPEIVGHLQDHLPEVAIDGTSLQWLFPGAKLSDGLRFLVDDAACMFMSECIVEGGAADVYVEEREVHTISNDDGSEKESDFEAEVQAGMVDVSSEEVVAEQPSAKVTVWDLIVGQEIEDEEDSSDGDYLPGDSSSSDDDEEGEQIQRASREFKRKLKKGEVANLDNVLLDNSMAAGSIGQYRSVCDAKPMAYQCTAKPMAHFCIA